MIGSNAFNYVDLLNKAADASWKRQEVISNNIANVDTPGYKRKDVKFDSVLASAVNQDASLDESVIDITNALDATVFTDREGLSYRLDGNNVDIDTEADYQAQNEIKYNALIDSMTQEFNRLKTVLTSR